MKRFIYIFIALFIAIMNSCNYNNAPTQTVNDNARLAPPPHDFDLIKGDLQQIITNNNEYKNPYSISVMREAFEVIKKAVESPNEYNSNLDIADIVKVTSSLKPTDFYIALRPEDSLQYASWCDTSLIPTFPFPLLLEEIDGYQSKQTYPLKNSKLEVPVLYGVCHENTLNDIIRSKVPFEIIDSLFLPENSTELAAYSHWFNLEQNTSLDEVNTQIQNQSDFAEAITHLAFQIVGLDEEKAKAPARKIANDTICETRHFLFWSWTHCDIYHHPHGKISIETPKMEEGVKGIKIRLFRWFRVDEVYTNEDGFYYDAKRWKQLWLTDDIHYMLVCRGQRLNNELYQNTWTLKLTVPLFPYWYNFGFRSAESYSAHIMSTSDPLWGRCVLNNAIYDYCNYAQLEGLTAPPYHLDILTAHVDKAHDWSASTPLLKNHLNISLLQIPFWGPFLEFLYVGMSLVLYPLLPDMILKFGSNLNNEDYMMYMNNTPFHELSHASHFQRICNQYGIIKASCYWSDIVAYEASHAITSGNFYPYGKIGETNWELVALAESWANFNAWYLQNKYIQPNNEELMNIKNSSRIDYYYSNYFLRLNENGITISNIERALSCAYTLNDFKNNLKNLCPQQINIINAILP